jgi:PAS domain S-box-containing protein
MSTRPPDDALAIARLRDCARASGDWLWELDAALRYSWISPAAGPARASPIGEVIDNPPLLDAGGEPLPDGPRLHDLFAAGAPFSQMIAADGERYVSRCAVPVLDAAGRRIGWRGTARDVTATVRALRDGRRRDAQLSRLADQVPGVLHQFTVDTQGHIHFPYASDGLGRLFGLLPQEAAAQSARVYELLHLDDRKPLRQAIARATQQQQPLRVEYRICPAGSTDERWVETQAVPEPQPDGSTLWHGYSDDITARKRALAAQQEAEQLRHEKEAAEGAARAKGELLSRLSHELRTPLNGIQGFAELMALDRDEPLGPTQARRLANVRRAGRRLLKLVDGVLELTRLDEGDVVLQAANLDLMRVLRHSLDLVRPLALNVGAVLPAVLPMQPLGVRGDARALEQVLVNLLANAIQHNRSRGQVGIELATEPPGRVAVTVTDEGPGLSAAAMERLFLPLQNPGGQGRGLGLAIAHRLVEAMGGELSVECPPGRGCRFRVELAAADAPLSLEDSGPGSLLAPLSTPAALDHDAPRRVLYIEDEPLNVLLMEEVFRGQRGWQLEVARDGERGIARAREAPPDLVLVDMNLPDMSGLAVVAALRAQAATAGLLCIALSADALPEQIASARAGGFDDYWTKPIDVSRLLAALARAIEQRD